MEAVGKPFISNSFLHRLKYSFLGCPDFISSPDAFRFGSELHKRVLEPEEDIEQLSEDEESLLSKMVESAYKEPFITDFLEISSNEKRVIKGKMGGILDMQAGPIGADLKTTSAKSHNAFIKSMYKYDYFRQAAIYCYVGDLEEFYFIGLQKSEPYKVYIIDCRDYQKEMEIALEELEFLLNLLKWKTQE